MVKNSKRKKKRKKMTPLKSFKALTKRIRVPIVLKTTKKNKRMQIGRILKRK